MEATIGCTDVEPAGIGMEFHGPAALVHVVVMPTTQRDQIAQIGRATVFPLVNVMELAP